jgi:hypothetical protein
MLDAIRAPLILRYLGKYGWPLIQYFIHDAALGRFFEVFEGVLIGFEHGHNTCSRKTYLNDQRPSLVTCK